MTAFTAAVGIQSTAPDAAKAFIKIELRGSLSEFDLWSQGYDASWIDRAVALVIVTFDMSDGIRRCIMRGRSTVIGFGFGGFTGFGPGGADRAGLMRTSPAVARITTEGGEVPQLRRPLSSLDRASRA